MKNRRTKEYLLHHSNIAVLAIALIVLFVIMSFLSPYFLNAAYLWKQSSFIAEMALIGLGMSLVILTGGIDLSVGSMMALTAVVTGMLSASNLSSPIAVIIGLCIGLIGGGLNGIIVCKAHVAPLIVTLGTMGLFKGIAMGITNGNAVKYPDNLYFLGQGKILGVPFSFLLSIILYLVAIYIINFTKMGVCLKAIGFNEEGAKFSGIHVDWEKIRVYMISGFLASLMGIIYSSRVTSAKADYGRGFEMNAITIAVFGGAVLSGGKVSVLGSFVATVIIVLLKQGLTLAHVQTEVQSVFVGLILIFAVAFNTMVNNKIKNV